MDNLNEKQLANLDSIVSYFNKNHPPKYIKGAIEHNSILSEFSPEELLDFALEEVLDLISYLVSLRDSIKRQREENETVSPRT